MWLWQLGIAQDASEESSFVFEHVQLSVEFSKNYLKFSYAESFLSRNSRDDLAQGVFIFCRNFRVF
jgi:hypothetical protein